MRTRRSPRNQDRLFKALFKPAEAPVAPVVTRCCGNCASYRDTGRSRGLCSLKGVRVSIMAAPGCFTERDKPAQGLSFGDRA